MDTPWCDKFLHGSLPCKSEIGELRFTIIRNPAACKFLHGVSSRKRKIRELELIVSRVPMVRQVPTWILAVQKWDLVVEIYSGSSPHSRTSSYMDPRRAKVRLGTWRTNYTSQSLFWNQEIGLCKVTFEMTIDTGKFTLETCTHWTWSCTDTTHRIRTSMRQY